MNSADALQQRLQIAEQLAAGYTPSQVAKRLDISRTTVYKVIRLLNAGEQLTDGRSSNLGKPTQYSDIWELIRQLREQKSFGPVMLYHTLKSNGDKYGLTINDIPSPATIGRWIHTQGLAAADPWLETLTSESLQQNVISGGKPISRTHGNLLQRVIYHY